MQIRRPLCLLSLIFVLLTMGCVYSGKSPDDMLPEEGEQITLTGTVKNKEYRVMYGAEIPVLYVNSVSDKNDRQVICYMKEEGEREALPRIGETVTVSGKVSLFREASNPGEFNLKEYYQILKISYKVNQTEILERSESCFPLKEKLFQIKCSCCEVLQKIYPEKEASVLKAMLLGEKNGLEEETKELYQLNGLIHILAISGLHVSLLGMAVAGSLKKWGMPVWGRVPVAVGIMWCYGMLTGMGVSTWRAIFMFMLHLAAELFGRTYDMLTALSLAAVFMLAEEPLLVRHSGFLLSFGAVLGIGVVLPWWKEVTGAVVGIGSRCRVEVSGIKGNTFAVPGGMVSGIKGNTSAVLEDKVQGKAGRNKIYEVFAKEMNGSLPVLIKKWQIKLTKTVKDGLCLSSAIAITTLPVLLYFYYKYPVYSLILNLYVIPLMAVVFAGGAVSLAAGFLWPEAGVLFGIPDRLILWLYEVSCRKTLKLPGAVKIGGRPEVWQIVIYYAILFFMVYWNTLVEERKGRDVFEGGSCETGGENRSMRGEADTMDREICIGNRTIHSTNRAKSEAGIPPVCQWLLVIGMVWLIFIRPVSGFSVFFLDVGQGDCIVMQNENGNCYMVDGGSTSKSRVGKYQILPFLESMGIGRLEAVFLTHPDEDHISGVMELMEQSAYGVSINSLILPDVSQKMKEEALAELISRAAEHGIPVYYIARGNSIQDGKLKFICLGPEAGFMTGEVNEISTVLYTEYGAFRMLLTGDVTGKPEKELLSELESREALTVLKVAHHGSKYSTSREFLEMTEPVYAVISAGKDNRYGHPHEELMERLENQGCSIYQTARSGAVTMKVKRGRIRVEEFLQ